MKARDAGTRHHEGGMPDISGLPPFLRVLLLTDGVVTRILEAYFGEPIDVAVLGHCELGSRRCYPQIGVDIGDRILSRRVVLRGHITQRPYVFASSIVVSDLLPREVRRSLVEDRKGIGELLSANRLETYRELIAIDRSDEGEPAFHLGAAGGTRLVSRTYKIHLGGRPVMLIEETFAEAMF